MNKTIRFLLAGLIAVVATAAVAFAASSDAPPAEPPSPDLPLEEAAALASPDVGERMPLCPDSDTIASLKKREMPFGPCLPIADSASLEERRAALADSPYFEPKQPVAEDSAKDCPTLEANGSEGAITAEFPCGADVEGDFKNLEDAFVTRGGHRCLKFDYTLDGKDTETRVFCPGGDPEGEAP